MASRVQVEQVLIVVTPKLTRPMVVRDGRVLSFVAKENNEDGHVPHPLEVAASMKPGEGESCHRVKFSRTTSPEMFVCGLIAAGFTPRPAVLRAVKMDDGKLIRQIRSGINRAADGDDNLRYLVQHVLGDGARVQLIPVGERRGRHVRSRTVISPFTNQPALPYESDDSDDPHAASVATPAISPQMVSGGDQLTTVPRAVIAKWAEVDEKDLDAILFV